jgi:hypothetical protein
MKKLSDCRVLLLGYAKANLDILVEGLKSDHKLSLALNGNKRGGVSLTPSGKSLFRIGSSNPALSFVPTRAPISWAKHSSIA